MTPLRLFVSSPADVMAERARVDVVAARLNAEFAGLAEIEPIRWETGFYTADRPFQKAIDEALDRMRATDIVVCLLWKRVGSELDPGRWHKPDGSAYESGTVLEFETALAASRERQGVPDVFLFRKDAPITYSAENVDVERAQHALMESVWRRWTATDAGHNLAGYQHFADADDFERQLELCLRQWLERRGIVLRTMWDRRLRGSPFRGLEAFEAEHAPVFFGREMALERAIGKLRQAEAAGAPFLLVVGASGAGKSSVLRAGLVPRITRPGTFPDIDLWRSALVVPAGDPFTSLAFAVFAEEALGAELRDGAFPTPEALAQCLAAVGDTALAPLRHALDRAARQRAEAMQYEAPRPARLLLAVDQVERLFIEAEPERAAAFAELLRALVAARLATVIVALRSDAYSRFQQVPGFVALIEELPGAVYNLLPPTSGELDDIVRKPVAVCEPPLAFESEAFADTLVADAKGGDALPLLQMTMQRLYVAEDGRGDGVLRAADYAGIAAAVSETAEEALAALDPAAQAELPALLTALVGDIAADAGGGALPFGTAVNRAAFERDLPARTALVDAFIAARLLTVTEIEGEIQVRAVHDALLRTWPAAVAIIGENAALIRVRHTLAPMAQDWAAADPAAQPGHLATSPALLAGAEGLLARFADDLPAAMREFITASLAADRHRREAERRRQRRVLGATAAGLVVALALAALAGWQWRVAEAQRNLAQHNLELATQTANGLVFDLAHKFRDSGVRAAIIADILARARKLQDQLTSGGQTSPDLRRSQAAALYETADTLLTIGDTNGALAAATQSRDIFQALLAAAPDSTDYQSALSVSDEKVGDVLVVQGDLAGALAAYRDSLAIRQALARKDPGNTEWQRDLSIGNEKVGDVLVAQGDLAGAFAAYRDDLTIAKALAQKDPGNTQWQRDLSVSDNKIGDVLRAQGDLAGALAAYRDGHAIFEALAQKDPGNTLWQLDLAVSDNGIGDVLVAQGDLAGALAAYREDHAICEALAQKDPGNTEWQRDLSISDNRIGDVLRAQGALAGALAAYRDSLAIRQALAQKDPGNTEWQRDMSIGNEKVGEVLVAQGDLAGALAAYRDGLAIAKALAQKDPGNTLWQRDLAVSDNGIGDVLVAQGDRAGALAQYRDGLAIAKALAQKDPGNTQWQRDLAVSDERVGDVLVAQGDLAGALAAYRDSLAIHQALAQRDPGNTDWQRDLSVSDNKIGDVLKAQGDIAGALAAYSDSLAIRQALARKDPGNTEWQRDLSVSDNKVGDALTAQGDLAGALAADRDGLAIAKALAQKDPGNTEWQRDLSVSDDKIGGVLQAQGDLPGALAARRDALTISKALAAKDPGNADWRRDLAWIDERIGEVLQAQGDLPGALAADEESLAIQRQLYVVSPTQRTKSDLVEALGNLSFVLLLDRRPQDALDRTQEALALDPSALWIETNRAHALLFLGRFDEAKAIYREDKDKPLGNGKTFGEVVKEDFAEFRKNGIDTPEMKEIESLLAS